MLCSILLLLVLRAVFTLSSHCSMLRGCSLSKSRPLLDVIPPAWAFDSTWGLQISQSKRRNKNRKGMKRRNRLEQKELLRKAGEPIERAPLSWSISFVLLEAFTAMQSFEEVHFDFVHFVYLFLFTKNRKQRKLILLNLCNSFGRFPSLNRLRETKRPQETHRAELLWLDTSGNVAIANLTVQQKHFGGHSCCICVQVELHTFK